MVKWAALTATFLAKPTRPTTPTHLLKTRITGLPVASTMARAVTGRRWSLSRHVAFPAAEGAIIRCSTRLRARSVQFIYKGPASGTEAPTDISCLDFHGGISLFPGALGGQGLPDPDLGANLAAFTVTGDQNALRLPGPRTNGTTHLGNVGPLRGRSHSRRCAKEVTPRLALAPCL
jgi:hypothetical protein